MSMETTVSHISYNGNNFELNISIHCFLYFSTVNTDQKPSYYGGN